MQSSNPPSSWLSSDSGSIYPDSLNINEEDDEEASTRTGSTRVEFIIGSPTRKRMFQSPWTVASAPRYFDSIDTMELEYPPELGEALAECDSLESVNRLDSDSY